ncbi:UBA-like domain-containing protein 1 isoform X2 [Rhineura floridana]|uniref:UBA-like domain-containing protein 1 isoform X2 n=1 Tax=Rhineura floridana TaxID=261503 RepID=UPI002AC81AAB|nr:UBA-like domain-containing protein 1 isoform X2 [Rhineura floridana]
MEETIRIDTELPGSLRLPRLASPSVAPGETKEPLETIQEGSTQRREHQKSPAAGSGPACCSYEGNNPSLFPSCFEFFGSEPCWAGSNSWNRSAGQTALSAFFQESSLPYSHPHHQMMCTPANTPATPPNFPDTLIMFSRLKASETFGSSPAAALAGSPPPPPLPQPGGFHSAWPACSPPGQPGAWMPATLAQPTGWPSGVSQQASSEPKASTALEAER